MNMMCIIHASRTHGVMNVGMHAHGWRQTDTTMCASTRVRAFIGERARVKPTRCKKPLERLRTVSRVPARCSGILHGRFYICVSYCRELKPVCLRHPATSTGLKHALPWDSDARHTAYKPYPKRRKGTSRHHGNDAPGSTEMGQRERKHNTGNRRTQSTFELLRECTSIFQAG